MGIKGNPWVTKIRVQMENITPLRICTGQDEEMELLIDSISGRPVIPGTSLSGACKAFLREYYGKHLLQGILGDKDYESKIYFADAYAYDNRFQLEFRTGIEQDDALGGAKKHHKYDVQYLARGSVFTVEWTLFAKDEEELSKEKEYMMTCINALHKGYISLGSKKTNGMGKMKILSVEQYGYHLHSANGLEKYLKNIEEYEEVKWVKEDGHLDYAVLIVKGNIDQQMLIKGEVGIGEDQVDICSMKDGFNQYIIPGSTLKGLWRSQAKKILTTINKDVSIVEDIFGTDSGSNKRESVLRRGNVFVQDTFILDYKEVHCHRIKIDRFTGGTMDGAKFDEKPINGTVSMQLMYKKSKDEKINHAAYALLLLTAREIALGNISIGSGNNVGYGRINGNEIVFKDGTNRMRIEFEDSKPIMSPDDQKIVDEWIGDLHNEKGWKDECTE